MAADPRLHQLAEEAANKIKALSDERDADIRLIYQQYQQQVAAIAVEGNTDSFGQTPVLPSHQPPIKSNPIR